jgi:hypothetical protein
MNKLQTSSYHTHNAEQVPCFQLIIRGKADPAALSSQALTPVLFLLRWPFPQNLRSIGNSGKRDASRRADPCASAVQLMQECCLLHAALHYQLLQLESASHKKTDRGTPLTEEGVLALGCILLQSAEHRQDQSVGAVVAQ